MTEKKATKVEIFGREYKIKGVADEKYIRDVAAYVDRQMRTVAQGASLPSVDRLAILAAMNVADDLFQERQRASDTYSRVESKTDALIEVLDRTLQAKG